MADDKPISIAANEQEEWRSVPNYTDYQVSNLGRMRSKKTRGRFATGDWRLMKLTVGKRGYVVVSLSVNGKVIRRTIHSVVCEAFIGPRPHRHDINHIDANKTNNALVNLEYCTRSHNERHAIRMGLKDSRPRYHGESHCNSRLTQCDADKIRTLLTTTKLSAGHIAKMFSISKDTMTSIALARTYTDSPGGPPQPINSRVRGVGKLTDDIAHAIREAYSNGEGSHRKLGKRFGVSRQTIGDIVRNKANAYKTH